MLLSFSVKNFRSFKDAQSLIMVPQNNLKECEENIGIEGKYKALKSVAILGHNASGKTNILGALLFMKSYILSFRLPLDKYQELDMVNMPFAYNNKTIDEPTEFEIELLLNNKKYRYGFSYKKNEIIAEWLFATDNKPNAREKILFVREKEVYIIKNFKGGSSLRKKTSEDLLFLSVCSFFNVTAAVELAQWFSLYLFAEFSVHGSSSKMTEKIFSEFRSHTMSFRKKNEDIIKETFGFIRNADLSIQKIFIKKNDNTVMLNSLSDINQDDTENIPPEYDIYSKHNIYDDSNLVIGSKDMPFNFTESDGTIKYFNISARLLNILARGGVYIIDELEACLHPLLFLHIVKLFNSKETNPNNAQLIFTTHNTNILDMGNMRRDQILFVEKDKGEASKVYPLSQFKVRKAQSFAKAYLFGRYGAVPILSDFCDEK